MYLISSHSEGSQCLFVHPQNKYILYSPLMYGLIPTCKNQCKYWYNPRPSTISWNDREMTIRYPPKLGGRIRIVMLSWNGPGHRNLVVIGSVVSESSVNPHPGLSSLTFVRDRYRQTKPAFVSSLWPSHRRSGNNLMPYRAPFHTCCCTLPMIDFTDDRVIC